MIMKTTIAKSERFRVLVALDSHAHAVTLIFEGELNEEAKLEEVSHYLERISQQAHAVLFDLGGVRSLNSAGVRQWISFMEELPTDLSVNFLKVCESLVDQANLVPHILGKSVKAILSVMVPYVCTICKTRSSCEIQISSLDFHRVCESRCPHCGGLAKLDGLVEEYMGFLSRLEP